MICKNCNTDNPEGSSVCSKCNQPLENKKKKKSAGKYGGLIAVFIFCAVLFVINSGILTKKYEVAADRTGYPIVYIKNNMLGVKPVKKSVSILSDYLLANSESMEKPRVFISENGEGVYFLEGYDSETSAGALFASYNGKTKVPISSKVYGNVQVSDDGKYALFIDMPDLDNNAGTLYLYQKNKEKEKIADNVTLDGFKFSNDSKNIVYTTQGDLYFQKIGSEREKIDSDVTGIVNISNFMSVLYTKANQEYASNLYYWKHNKEAVLVGEKVSSNLVFTSSISDNFYFCGDSASSTNSSLYYREKNKKAELVDTNVLSPLVWDCNYNNVIYTKNFSMDDYSSDTYFKKGKRDAKKLATTSETTRATVSASYDFGTIVYLSEINPETKLGKLYLKKNSVFKNQDPVLISENVYDFDLSKDGKTLVYVESANASDYTMHLYKNKTDTVIAENVQGEHFELTQNSRAVIYLSNYNADKDSGNLFCKSLTNPKKESVKIDTEVTKHFSARNEKQVVYTKNYDNNSGESELCLWKGKKSETVDKGIINIMFEE